LLHKNNPEFEVAQLNYSQVFVLIDVS